MRMGVHRIRQPCGITLVSHLLSGIRYCLDDRPAIDQGRIESLRELSCRNILHCPDGPKEQPRARLKKRCGKASLMGESVAQHTRAASVQYYHGADLCGLPGTEQFGPRWTDSRSSNSNVGGGISFRFAERTIADRSMSSRSASPCPAKWNRSKAPGRLISFLTAAAELPQAWAPNFDSRKPLSV